MVIGVRQVRARVANRGEGDAAVGAAKGEDAGHDHKIRVDGVDPDNVVVEALPAEQVILRVDSDIFMSAVRAFVDISLEDVHGRIGKFLGHRDVDDQGVARRVRDFDASRDCCSVSGPTVIGVGGLGPSCASIRGIGRLRHAGGNRAGAIGGMEIDILNIAGQTRGGIPSRAPIKGELEAVNRGRQHGGPIG